MVLLIYGTTFFVYTASAKTLKKTLKNKNCQMTGKQIHITNKILKLKSKK